MNSILRTFLFPCALLLLAADLNAQELRIRKTHPRLILSAGDIRTMRRNALSGEEPFASCWDNFSATLEKKLSGWQPKPYSGSEGLAFFRSCMRDGGMARDLAIAWQITRERRYADKALSLLGAWVSLPAAPGIALLDDPDSPNIGMMAARGVIPFLYAYDLLQADGLVAPQLQARFEAWLRELVHVIEEGGHRWKWNNYYDRQYYQNHLAADAAALLMIGVTLRDEELAQYALDSRANERDLKDVIQGAILMKGQKPYYREEGSYPVHDGEIIDRYRHFVIGGQYKDYKTKPCRALQYCNLTTLLMVIAAETCSLNGVDLYAWEGESGENIRLPLLFYADFYIEHDCGEGLYKGEEFFINANNTATSALWEVAHARYPREPKFAEVLRANDRAAQSDLHLLGPVTLTHGRK